MAERKQLTLREKRNRRVMLVLTGVVAGMIGMAYASVPLYRIFCSVTGYQGTPRIASTDSSQARSRSSTSRAPSHHTSG